MLFTKFAKFVKLLERLLKCLKNHFGLQNIKVPYYHKTEQKLPADYIVKINNGDALRLFNSLRTSVSLSITAIISQAFYYEK